MTFDYNHVEDPLLFRIEQRMLDSYDIILDGGRSTPQSAPCVNVSSVD